MSKAGTLAALALLAGAPAAAAPPIFPEFPPPHRYGRVVLDNFSSKAGMAPVAFDHWRHRTLYTCRVCHVDVGFVMEAGSTQISAETNRSKLHCGACHDGTRRHEGRVIFAACSSSPRRPPPPACEKCHRRDSDATVREAYEAFAQGMPKDRTGVIDWEQFEGLAFEKPADYVEGVSLRPDRLKTNKDFSIPAIGTWLGDVAFSHPKHARWSGCEGCHPEVFPSTSRGAIQYRMTDIVAGKYCGACHSKVAFPIAACLRCHRTPQPGARASQR